MIPDLKNLVQDAWNKKEYQPVAVAIISDKKGRVILLESAKKRYEWSLPQGGIDEDESAEDALFREIKKKISIDRTNLTLIQFLGAEDLDAPDERPDEQGFTKGKRYFFFYLSWNGNGALRVDEQELRSCALVRVEDTVDFLLSLKAEKKMLLLKFLLRVAGRVIFGEPRGVMTDKSSLDELRQGLPMSMSDYEKK
ncbi:MAG TPA: NUDIX hydrolase [Candidatus Paceibacterota bacterium]